MSTLLFSAAQLPTPPLLEPSSKGSRRKPRPQPLEKLEALLSLSGDLLPSPSNLATPPPSYDSLYAVDGGYVRVRDTDNVDDRSDIAEFAAYMFARDLKEKHHGDKMENNPPIADVPEMPVQPLKGPDTMEKIIQAESLLSSLAGMLDHQNDAVSDLKSQLFGIEDVLKELHVQQQMRQEELSATQCVETDDSDSDSEESNFTPPLDGEPLKPYASILSSHPNPHPSLSSPAVITKTAKRSSLTPDSTTRPRRHSLSMKPPSPADPAEEDGLNEDTFDRISGILSSLIVEAQEAVEENPHAPRRPRPVSRASLVRPKSRLSLRWDSSDSESDDEESNAKAKRDDSDSEHDAAVAAVTTAGLFEDSDPEDDFLDDDDEEYSNKDLEELRKSMFPVDTEDVAIQAEDMYESPIEEPLQAFEQAHCRLGGDRSRPSSWGSSGSTSTLVDHSAPAPSPSVSMLRRNPAPVPSPSVSLSRRNPAPAPSPSASMSRRTKHMSFDLKPTTEFLESMKRIDDSLAEVDFLSKDLVEDLVEDDFEALLNAPPTAPPPLRRNPKRQYRSVGTDTSDLAFAAQPGQHPSEPFAALSAPTTPTTAAKASYLFSPAMRARIITSILFPLLHIPHAFVSDSLNGGGAAFHFAAVGDAATAAGAFRFANVLTWTFLFTVGSLMMDSVTGRSVAQIVDVWHRKDVHGHSHGHAQDDESDDLVRTMIRNGFVKQNPRRRVISAAGSTETNDSIELLEDESTWAPEGKEWRVPGAYYPPRSEYERLSNVMELLPNEQRMFDNTEETVRGIPGAYYYYSGTARKPDEVDEVDVKVERRLRTDHVRHSLPVTLRHEQGAPLRQALLESLFKKGVGKPVEEGWKSVVVVHDLDGDKTDVVVTEDDGCGAEDHVLEIVAVKKRKVAAPGRRGSLVVMGRRNSI